jgi:hypothetical protein
MCAAERIMIRLHPSAILHFARIAAISGLELPKRENHREKQHHRQLIHNIFCCKNDDDTINEVIRRLHDYVSKRKELKLKRKVMQISKRQCTKPGIFEYSSALSVSSSLEESEYLGDTSDASSIDLTA